MVPKLLNKHNDLTKRLACNIKKKRAVKYEKTIELYVSNLEKELYELF